MVLLANMSILAKRRVSAGRHNRSALAKQPFVAERSTRAGDTLAAIYALLERALSKKNGAAAGEPEGSPGEPLSEGDEETVAAAIVTATPAGPSTASAGSFVISSLLQVLAANVQHLIQVQCL